MADIDYLDLTGPDGRAQKQLDELRAGVRALISDMVAANKAAKGIEFNIGAAKTIKDITQQSQSLVDANGRLVGSYTEVSKAAELYTTWKAKSNGSTEAEIAGTSKVIKLKQEEEKARLAAAKTLEAENKAKIAGAKSAEAAARAADAENKSKISSNRLADQGAKARNAEAKATALLSNEYAQMSKAQQELALKAKNYALTLGETHPITVQAQQDADKLSTILKRLDSATGDHRRSVGDYTIATRGLRGSIQQIARELPSISNGFATFASAIGNNIAPAADAIAEFRAEQKKLAAEGKPTQSLFKALGASIFSFQTLLLVGVTLLTVYGKEIGDWAKDLFSAGRTINTFTANIEAMQEALGGNEMKQAIVDVQQMYRTIKLAQEGTVDATKALNMYNKGLGEVIGSAKSLEEAESLLVKKGDAYVRMTLYKAAATAAQAKAGEALLKQQMQQLEDQRKATEIAASASANPLAIDPIRAFDAAMLALSQRRQKAAEKQFEDYDKIAADLFKKSADIAKNAGIDFIGDQFNDPKKKEERKKKIKDMAKEQARLLAEETKKTLEQTKGRYELLAAQADASFQNEKNSQRERLNALDRAMLAEISIIKTNGAIQGDTTEAIQAKITEIVTRFTKKRTDFIESEGKRQAKLEKDNFDALSKLGGPSQSRKDLEAERLRKAEQYTQEAIRFANSLADVNNAIEARRIQAIDNEIAKIKERADIEVALYQESSDFAVATERERNQKINDIRGAAAAKAKQLEEERIQRARKAAQFEKGVTIAQIIATTALAVVKALTEGDPYTKALRAGIAGAMGAAQLAAAIAAPIPAYKFGTPTGGHPEDGPALVGDGYKRELRINPDGSSSWTPAVPTVEFLPKGTHIIPTDQIMNMTRLYDTGMARLTPRNKEIDLGQVVTGLAAVKQAIERKPESSTYWTWQGVVSQARIGGNTFTRLHNNRH